MLITYTSIAYTTQESSSTCNLLSIHNTWLCKSYLASLAFIGSMTEKAKSKLNPEKALYSWPISPAVTTSNILMRCSESIPALEFITERTGNYYSPSPQVYRCSSVYSESPPLPNNPRRSCFLIRSQPLLAIIHWTIGLRVSLTPSLDIWPHPWEPQCDIISWVNSKCLNTYSLHAFLS